MVHWCGLVVVRKTSNLRASATHLHQPFHAGTHYVFHYSNPRRVWAPKTPLLAHTISSQNPSHLGTCVPELHAVQCAGSLCNFRFPASIRYLPQENGAIAYGT